VRRLCFVALVCLLALPLSAAKKEDSSRFSSSTFSGLSFRALGPALTSGRVADIAVDPRDHSTWIVATASGGVWRTANAGTTWTPVFDGEGSYSIGCATFDPSNSLIVWVGSGENNSQRSVSYGDGIYKSMDGGRSWKNMGLANSQHIAKILVDPRDSEVVYAAVQGPLWNAGGDRGLYKTIDGGETWTAVLEISEHTGITDIAMDPRNPDVLYAAAYQRRRHTWTLINGGPEGALYKSTDAGANWEKLERGLPEGDVGRIGIAVAPTNGDIVYAVIEAAGDESGTYRSTNAGVSFDKRGPYVSGSPQYYQELIVDPTDADVVYSNDTWLRRTEDGGANWTRINDGRMHVDNHAVWIDPTNPAHLVVGNDGGVYESFDRAATWTFKENLPITQFYKAAIDEDFPFYNVYGGTQDNNTIGGPTRSTSANGIQNSDWFITLGGDGFEPAIDPEDPNVVYSQWQYGNLHRYDRRSGENIDIQPQPEPGDEPLVWNWSSALLISPHSSQRLYFGGNYLFRSDDRGDNWERISSNMTRQIDRNELEVMGRVWGVDTVAKNRSTSIYGNIVALDESPLQEDLLYAGTDDGLIWMSDNAGQNWVRYDKFSGVPEMSYITGITTSRHDPDTVYATFSNHKKGDFTPYVIKSTNRGKKWTNAAGDLPERGQAHDLVEDHVDPKLLFVGTEFGVFFTRDGGQKWIQLKGGLPTVACRDLEIQRRENDLVVATFGRGFYVLDDYSALRHSEETRLDDEKAMIFPVKKSWMFFERTPLGLPGGSSMGDQHYFVENPPVGATFTYYLRDELETKKELRQASEKELWQQEKPLHYPTWDQLRDEDREREPAVWLTVRDSEGNVVRRIAGQTKSGIHRASWNFRYASAHPTNLSPPAWRSPWDEDQSGPMAMPGRYTVELHQVVEGTWTRLVGPTAFECEVLAQATLPATDREALASFQRRTANLQRAVLGAARVVSESRDHLAHARAALLDTPGDDVDGLLGRVDLLDRALQDLQVELNGDRTVARRSEATMPGLLSRVGQIVGGHWTSSSAATGTQRRNYDIVATALPDLLERLRALAEGELRSIEAELEKRGSPWTPGRIPEWSGSN
jgi:photosystem II stability/assembly factor-like uncharacterized protein